MRLYILNSAYDRVGVIDASESVLWNKKYNDKGECEIYIPCDDEHLSLLRKGYYIYREDDDMFCKIQRNEIQTDVENGDYIIATAPDICKILEGRVVSRRILYVGTVAGFVERVLNENVINPEQPQRRIDNFEIDTSNFSELSDTIEVSAFGDDVLMLIMTTCKSYNYGFRLSYNMETRKLVFKLYKGKNKASATSDEYVEFSPRFANILSTSYVEDDTNYKNVVYISYESDRGDTQLLPLFEGEEPQGENRREVVVDGTGVSREVSYDDLLEIYPTAQRVPITQESEEGVVTIIGYSYFIPIEGGQMLIAKSEGSGEDEKITVTDYAYYNLLREVGYAAFAEYVKTQEYTGNVDTIDTYEYKVHYDLGDIVKVINEYGIEAEAQVTAIMESDDNEDGYNVEPTFEFLS